MADREAAKRLILKIVAVAGFRLDAVSRLNKAFYAAHLIYWHEHQALLSEYPIVKLENGPGIDDFEGLIRELVGEGKLEVVEGMKGPYPQRTLVVKGEVQIDIRAPEYEAIRKAVDWVKTRSTPELSEITHGKPSYDAQPRIGYEQPIYLDLLTDDEYEEIRARCREVDDAFQVALGT